VSSSGLAVRGNASAADRDFKEGLARTVARPGAAAGRISIPDYACRRSHRTAVDAGSLPAASINFGADAPRVDGYSRLRELRSHRGGRSCLLARRSLNGSGRLEGQAVSVPACDRAAMVALLGLGVARIVEGDGLVWWARSRPDPRTLLDPVVAT
jgi:hypothetical protein